MGQRGSKSSSSTTEKASAQQIEVKHVTVFTFCQEWPRCDLEVPIDVASKRIATLTHTAVEDVMAVLQRDGASMVTRKDAMNCLVELQRMNEQTIDLSKSLVTAMANESDATLNMAASVDHKNFPVLLSTIERRRNVLEELLLPLNFDLQLRNEFFSHISDCKSLRVLDVSNCRFDSDCMTKYLSSTRLDTLRLRKCELLPLHIDFSAPDAWKKIIASLRTMETLTSLDLEEVGLTFAFDMELADLVHALPRLRALKVSNNDFRSLENLLRAVGTSRIEQFGARSCVRNGNLSEEACRVLLRNQHLYLLDYRNNSDDNAMEKALCAEAGQSKLYSLWINSVNLRSPGTLLEAIAESNDTIGILYLGYTISEGQSILRDNVTLFDIQPNPVSHELVARLQENRHLASYVRNAIIGIMTMRKFHREDSGAFAVLPREIVTLIAKYVWKTRGNRAWRAYAKAHGAPKVNWKK
jgi:hypothetical protein